MVGANCRGKVTADVRRVELNMGPLLRGKYEERVDMDRRLGDLPRFSPSLSRGKDLLLLLVIAGVDSLIRRVDLSITMMMIRNLSLEEI